MRPALVVAAVVLSAVTFSAAQPQAPPPTVPGVQQTPGPRAPAQPAAPVRDTGGRPPAAPPGTSTLTGIVTTYAGQPAVGARIMVGGEGPPRMAMTDARGRFSVASLRAGRYNVTASKPGYVTVTYGQLRVNSQGTPVPLGDGETRNIAMQLPRAGVITGMVLDERGEPAVNAFVRVMRFMPGAGGGRPQQTGGDNTDDRGIYRVHSLQPGDYAVCATYRGSGPQNDAQRIQMELDSLRRAMTSAPSAGARQQMAMRLSELQAQMPAQSEPATGYGNVCFPGSSPSASTKIPVAAGEEKGGIDLQLQITQVARIEGQVVAPSGVEPRSVQLNLTSADEAATPIDRPFAEIDEQGKFVFHSVPPGGYKILARSMPRPPGPPGPGAPPAQQPLRLWANADITVAGQDITGLVLELQRGVTISGQVAIHSTATPPPADLSRVMISVFPSSPESPGLMMMGGPPPQATVEANGRFTRQRRPPRQLPRQRVGSRGSFGGAGLGRTEHHRRGRGRARHATRRQGSRHHRNGRHHDRSDHRALRPGRRRKGQAHNRTYAGAVPGR